MTEFKRHPYRLDSYTIAGKRRRENPPINWDIYQSPFTLRNYGSKEMHYNWSPTNQFKKQRQVWLTVADIQREAGLVTDEEYQDLEKNADRISIPTVLRRELDRNDPRFTGHDGMAAITEYADKARIGGGKLHQGLTTEDNFSQVEGMLTREALTIIEKRLATTIESLIPQIDKYKDLVCLGYTHLQAAEPTTFGYRLAGYAQDLAIDLINVRVMQRNLKSKGIKGAVGTSASFAHLLKGTDMTPEEHERMIMEKLGLEPVVVAGQTTPRKYVLETVMRLASIGQSAYKFANDIKLLQASPFDEAAEPRRRNQVGSSAMPHKANPNTAEGIKALTAGLPGKVTEAWIGAASVMLERGLEDSAGKRSYLPESFLIVDEALMRMNRIISNIQVREFSINRNLGTFGPFAATEIVLAETSRHGADRQQMHENLRVKAQTVFEDLQRGESNQLQRLVEEDPEIAMYLNPTEIDGLFKSVNMHVGDAPARCVKLNEGVLKPLLQIK